MKYQEFKNRWLGKGIDYDGFYGFQCFDVINQYILDITNQKPYIRLATADQIFKQPNDIIPAGVDYQLIANADGVYPQQGDIIVWEKAQWNGFGGHTGVVDNANNDRGLVFQQNGAKNWEGCQLIEWNFWNHTPLGWIRLNVNPPAPTPQPQPTQNNFVTVQAGWGLSNVAQAAGLPINESTYTDIYNLNPGHRGARDWRSLNARMGAGDVLRVRPEVVAQPQIDSVNKIPEPSLVGIADNPKPIQPQPEAISIPAPTPPMPHIEVPELPKPEIKIETINTENYDKIKALESQLSTSYDLARQLISKKNSIMEKLKSRKLWAAIVGVIYAICSVYYPELEPVLPQVITIITGYIGVEGVADIIQRNKR